MKNVGAVARHGGGPLGHEVKFGVVTAFAGAAHLVKPIEPETLTAICEHPKLKSYLKEGIAGLPSDKEQDWNPAN